MYDALPVEYKSVTNSCEAEEGTDNKVVTCTFTGFKDEEDKELTGKLMIDALSVDLRKLQYQNSGDCTAIYTSSDEDEKMTAIFDANHNLHIDMKSPAGTVATVKPYLSNWDYVYMGETEEYDDNNLYISTSNFYRETFNPSDTFTMTIYSGCPLKVDSFTQGTPNNNIHVRVFGYQQ